MTTLDEARDVLAEYRATPASSTRRRVRLAIRMKDIEEEFADRLLDGANQLLFGSLVFDGHQYDDQWIAKRKWWLTMNDVRNELLAELNNLGMTPTQLHVAFATTLFDAEVIHD